MSLHKDDESYNLKNNHSEFIFSKNCNAKLDDFKNVY